MQVATLHPLFAACVEGLDLRQPLTAEQARWVEARMDEYAVLVFPGQNLTDEQQIAFGENFGLLEGETATVDGRGAAGRCAGEHWWAGGG